MSFKLTTAVKPQGNINFTAILYGSLLAVIASVILMALGGTVMFYTIFNERLVPVIGLAILFVSIFLGGLVSARRAGKMGWLHGLGVGLIFLVLATVFSTVFPHGVFGFAVLKKTLAAVIAGCLGGIWGVGE